MPVASNYVSQIVYAAGREHVTDVWVAGKQKLKDRQLICLNEKELLAVAKTWQQQISTTE